MSADNSVSSIKSVLSGLLAGINADNEKAYRELAETDIMKLARQKVEEGDPEDFYYGLLYPMEQVVEGLLESVLPQNDKAQFIFKHFDFVEQHVKTVIVRFEGSPCSADKASAVIRRLLGFYLKGHPVVFDPDEEYTYHHPKKVLTTHGEIVEFFEAIQRLYYGDGDAYFKAVAKMMIATIATDYPSNPVSD